MKVKIKIRYVGDSKAAAITTLRKATGVGANEARKFVEKGWAARLHIGEIMLNQAQFGRFIMETMTKGEEAGVILYGKPEIITRMLTCTDFSDGHPN